MQVTLQNLKNVKVVLFIVVFVFIHTLGDVFAVEWKVLVKWTVPSTVQGYLAVQ